MLRGQRLVIVGRYGAAGSDNECEKVEHFAIGGLRPAAGDGVRANDWPGAPGTPPAARGHPSHSSTISSAGKRGNAARCGLARLASIAIS